MKKNCLQCGKEIHVKPSQYDRKKYCSRSCKTDYQQKNPPQFWKDMNKKVTVKCSYCKQPISRKPSTVNKTNFCNVECKRLYQLSNGHLINQHLRKDVKVICQQCSQEFTVPKNREKSARYCSKGCLGKANGERGKIQYKKQIKLNCIHCSKEFEKKPSTLRKLNFCSQACMAIYYAENQLFTGEKSGTWNGGSIDYYGPNWRNQRKKARKRDHYTCQDCGIAEKEYGQQLSVHHITPFREFKGDWRKANELSNLITLCEYPCHRKRHSNNG